MKHTRIRQFSLGGIRFTIRCVISVVIVIASCVPVQAGGGPENVVLVVNGRSWSSQTIANYYQRLRHIPKTNVIQLDWSEDLYRIPIDTYRRSLLEPVLREIESRQLVHADYIIFSCDFPYEIQFDEEKKPDDKFPSGSLTGMTYLWQLVRNPLPAPLYSESNTNWYASQVQGDLSHGATRAFRAWWLWNAQGEQLDPKEVQGRSGTVAQRYFLSTMLGYTGPRGNTVHEVVRYLRASAAADGTHPEGTIYYGRTSDVRSITRDRNGAIERAVAELQQLGVQARVMESVLPIGRNDVQGVMIGVSDFDWPASRSTLLPGAIAEHLTSFGAVFHRNAQTPVSTWMRYGAAGTSGAVIEPYALQSKFPHPRIHVHYARGCSLAEAFYQSITGPYQLLILGDPLCQPWASSPIVLATGINARKPIRGEVVFRPMADSPANMPVKEFRAYLDGQPVAVGAPGQVFRLNSQKYSDGHHELRVVAIDHSSVETQGRQILDLTFANRELVPELKLENDGGEVAWNSPISLRAKLQGARSFEVYHNMNRLTSVSGEDVTLRVNPSQIGSGPVRLDVAAVMAGPPVQRVWGSPIMVNIGWRPQ